MLKLDDTPHLALGVTLAAAAQPLCAITNGIKIISALITYAFILLFHLIDKSSPLPHSPFSLPLLVFRLIDKSSPTMDIMIIWMLCWAFNVGTP